MFFADLYFFWKIHPKNIQKKTSKNIIRRIFFSYNVF